MKKKSIVFIVLFIIAIACIFLLGLFINNKSYNLISIKGITFELRNDFTIGNGIKEDSNLVYNNYDYDRKSIVFQVVASTINNIASSNESIYTALDYFFNSYKNSLSDNITIIETKNINVLSNLRKRV